MSNGTRLNERERADHLDTDPLPEIASPTQFGVITGNIEQYPPVRSHAERVREQYHEMAEMDDGDEKRDALESIEAELHDARETLESEVEEIADETRAALDELEAHVESLKRRAE